MATKKQRPNDKLESSEDKIKGNALYFMQGREVRLHVFDIPAYLRSIESLPAEEKEASLASLAKSQRSPKLTVLTHDGEGETKNHRSLPLVGENGIYTFQVPDIFPRDGADKYEVCDTVHVKRSFTKSEHDAWEAHSEKHELSKTLADQSDLRRKIREAIPSDEDIKSTRAQLPELRKTQKQLIEKQQAAYLDVEVTEEQLEKMGARLNLVTTRIKELETELSKWEGTNDPFQKALEASPLRARLQELSDKTNLAFLEFMHQLSVQEGKTTESFDEWTARATAQDYLNAIELVGEGNAFWTYGGTATPLSRDEERKRELHKHLSVN
jgi:hypothetical protein